MDLVKKLAGVESRFLEVESRLSDPQTISDQNLFRKLSQEHSSLSEIVDAYRRYKSMLNEIKDNKELLHDSEMAELAKEELKRLEPLSGDLEKELQFMLLPKDPNDHKNIILEVRAGAGGDEASLFVGDLFRMYQKFVEKIGWKVELMSSNPIGIGGYKEIIAMITGNGAYSKFRYEAGVHRVQRVPDTEAQGRIHTSTVTVAVMPEAEEVDFELHATDLKIDVFRSGGAGGQSVNTTDSAVRITHLPTNTVVVCQDERSQLKNKDKAMKILRSRLYEVELERKAKEEAAARKGMVGTGDRSERIRTYNYPQGRVTDHRINLTLYQLPEVMEGKIEELIQGLHNHYQTEALKNQDASN